MSVRTRLLTAAASLLAALPAQSPSDLDQRIQRIVAALPPATIVAGDTAPFPSLADRMAATHVPGVSVAYIHDGKIAWARGFGVTRIGGPPVTPDTLFQAASISKPVTALAALRLVQSGKLDLNTPVNQYLKSWKLPGNQFTEKTPVTLRELLTHTAGLTVHGFPGYASDAPVPTLVQVLNGEKPANSPPIRVDTEPGTIWRYSGGGYEITQQLLQDTTGEAFPKLMHDSVLAPIGMEHSTYQQPLPAARMSEVATPDRGDGQPVPGGPHVYPEMAAAGLWTTPSDLARYAIEVQNALAGTSTRVISAATARLMLTPVKNDQGLGPGLGGTAPHRYFTHGGANEGYRCNVVAYENGDGVAIMTNGDNGGQVASELLRSIAREYHWPDFAPAERTTAAVDTKTLDTYTGVYQSAAGPFTVTREGEQLFVQLGGQPKMPVFPQSQRVFFSKVVDAQIEFAVDSTGKPTQLILHQNGQDLPAKRLDDAAAKQVTDEAAARAATAAARFKEQKAAPGSEAALRRTFDEIRSGQIDYSRFEESLGNLIRQQASGIQSTITQLGALQAVTYKGVGPGGADIYELKFEKGSIEARIGMSPDGKVAGLGIRPQ